MRRARFLAACVAALVAFAPAARAEDPGRWLLTGATSVPSNYWQGLTTDPADSSVYFAGVFEGLWKTDPSLAQTAGVPSAIPAAVKQAEGYNHIGDPTWDAREGGRVVLPLECYTPGVGNTCGTGSFGIADPQTLAFRYYVRLDPAEIPKAMWAETSPDGSLIWTSAGNDLLAYPSSAVVSANRAPAGPCCAPPAAFPPPCRRPASPARSSRAAACCSPASPEAPIRSGRSTPLPASGASRSRWRSAGSRRAST